LNFRYQSIDPAGRNLAGELQAENRKEALNRLKQQGLRVVRLQQAGDDSRPAGLTGKVKREEMLLALSELAALLRSGVGLKDSIDSLSGGKRGQALQTIIERWSAGLRRGEPFSDVLRSSGAGLPEYLVQLVRAGEMTGELGNSLQTGVDRTDLRHVPRHGHHLVH